MYVYCKRLIILFHAFLFFLSFFFNFTLLEKVSNFRDLAIALRKRLGHWFRVVELLKMSASTTEAQVKQAYSNIGDYYIDRQNW